MKKVLSLVIVLLFVPLTTSAQDFCKGNFDYDDNVDGSDASTFKSHFGRGGYNNPCPPDGPAPVQRTGQTMSFHWGDDADLLKGVEWPSPRFTDNLDGIVTDNLTGLIWLKNANCFGLKDWEEAVIVAWELSSENCGLTDGSSPGDWRLPNLFELESLRDMQYWEPALSNSAGTGQWTHGDPFTNLLTSGFYWSSTSYAYNNNINAWDMFMGNGGVNGVDKDNTRYIWPVRGGR